MHNKTLTELRKALHQREYSSVELTRHFLERIERYGIQLNSFITVTTDIALAQAQIADKCLQSGNAGPLTGIPLTHKDIFCTNGVKTSCGSKMLDNFIAPYNATVVEKCQAAGMVMLGKTNMDEFAMGSSNETSFYGPVKNPWDTQTVPGGSSGGSTASVAAHLTPVATGTDTGGSIRQPAAFCGLTGLKPTYGLVSRYGMIAFASSLDQGGPIGHSAEDIALLLNVMAGFDKRDSTSLEHPQENYTTHLNDSIKGLKIGLPKEYFGEGLDAQVGKQLDVAIKELENAGATLHDIQLPHTYLAVPTYYIIAPAECSSNLSRFDGVRFGHRCDNPQDLMDLYKRSRAEGFGAEVKRRIMIGTYALSAGYYDAYYLKAQQIRRLISNDFTEAFKQVDMIAGPTTPTTAFKMGEKIDDPVTMYLNDIYTNAINLAGLPALSVPAGFVNQHPIGLHLIGNYLKESRLLNVAHQYQQCTDWHKATPPNFV
ncbi:Asp-tRNA(Asn)/Glu-tRNA(Gln) amidotransferase subunit GatA [Candidatus Parabeggiatoa sp. HSG14]|uniref:Asp-tRNA(Asn)/Glu-tRNA(Gln) amidotransferase subunit GatA n=1 Tax=Candidatus Parabeggiatoa sp. HSG14 TaxID=3055593 RepID=UPI0025A8B7AF|nr:Asp-tRNA(Asn)/Glu-tRNA(Gln) amidotransferase subunit GatA [Thiotrichales bacterium HSG14]